MSTLALAVVGTPEFVVGFFLILVFATQLGWFPAVSLLPLGVLDVRQAHHHGASHRRHILIGLALVRPVRAVVERENQTLHVESARLSGLPERR